MKQTAPRGFNQKKLEKYAKTFFGFGNWKADCWLIGSEERGCGSNKKEFSKRYAAWKKCGAKQLVSLKFFFDICCIEKTPDWNNRTWRYLHCICRLAGLSIGKLCENNNRWGGNLKIKHGSQVALMEASPFPASSSSDWPYEKWKQFLCMKNRRACNKLFAEIRTKILKAKLKKYEPKLIIDYSNNRSRFGFKFQSDSIKYETSARSWKFDWAKINNKTLFVRINHVSRMPLKVLVEISDRIQFLQRRDK